MQFTQLHVLLFHLYPVVVLLCSLCVAWCPACCVLCCVLRGALRTACCVLRASHLRSLYVLSMNTEYVLPLSIIFLPPLYPFFHLPFIFNTTLRLYYRHLNFLALHKHSYPFSLLLPPSHISPLSPIGTHPFSSHTDRSQHEDEGEERCQHRHWF